MKLPKISLWEVLLLLNFFALQDLQLASAANLPSLSSSTKVSGSSVKTSSAAKTTTSSQTSASSKNVTSSRNVTSTSMPKITSSAGTTLYSNSSTWSNNSAISTSITSSSVYIPITDGNKSIYQARHPNGTVFIAFASCLGAILLSLTGVWIALSIKSWRSARRENKLRNLENQYQCDPFYFQSNANDDESETSSRSGDSDISEKVLKNKSSRMSLYTLGSTSVLNLLNNKPDTNDNFRSSMFISPTEILQYDANNSNTLSQQSNGSVLYESLSSTPREPGTTQIIGKFPDNANPFNYTSLNIGADSGDGLTPKSNVSQGKVKKYRPPSVHLDQLLDANE
ncbi:YOL007C [Saccharomyces arboricola H-6]|uniref:YOL007C n=1 Tax=Saccharomyces arboricola (strain H-6 / AS 2.3317 / CBS 10644) TaxID=1160507 RepID=J8PI45_SACAR|nr:YOL007C [Saccharomyces arboricola H-6]